MRDWFRSALSGKSVLVLPLYTEQSVEGVDAIAIEDDYNVSGEAG